ncbi:hypothetical protein [Lacisediminimonas profundi]|uniref:hypothetical protein n=1 Tax=Lacisediminimonas profundi TaxID=2603856 RepID=UPI00124B1B34|nr:hypothetical protein [Lacisediminimonas profundi]
MQRTSRKHPGLPVGGPARQAPVTKITTGLPTTSTSARPKRTGMLALSLRANRIPHAPVQPRSYLPPQLKVRQGTKQEALLQDALMDALVEHLVQASWRAESCPESDRMAQRTATGLGMLRDWIIGMTSMTSPAIALDLPYVRRKIVMQMSAVAAPMATRMALVMACLMAAQASGYRHGARLQMDFVKMANRAPDEERLALLLAACCTTGPRTSTNDSLGLGCALAADALRNLQEDPLRRALVAAARLVTSLAAQAAGAPGPRLHCLEEFITMLASHLRRQLPECAEVRTLVRRCAGRLAGLLAPLPHGWAIALRTDLKTIEADARQNLERLAGAHLEQMEQLVQDCTQS